MTTIPKLMQNNPLFFNFYNNAYPNCTFALDVARQLLTITLLHSIRVYRIELDGSIKY